MECNKDEAIKAKEVAAKKLLEKDIPGAKKFALKAQTLFPNLDDLSQLLEIIDVHVAHEKKINGEADYYGILGVDRFANEDVLKKQYKKMALSLHPDKNKSAGADGAFKILSQAWSVLSDINRRTSYDSKLNVRSPNYTAVTLSSSSAANPTVCQFNRAPSPPFRRQYSPFTKPETFWTTCGRCMMHYEYNKMYLNQNLLCGCCRQPFLATETPAPSPKVNNRTSSRPWHLSHDQQQQHAFAGSQSVPSETVIKMMNSSFISEETKAPAVYTVVGGLARDKPVKRRRRSFRSSDILKNETSGVKRASEKMNGNLGSKRESRNGSDLSQIEIRAMLVRKAKMGILDQLNEWEAEESRKSSRTKRVEKKDSIINHVEIEQSKDDLLRDTLPTTKSPSEDADDADASVDEAVSMMVPDANFHNFDEDRVELSFSENQVWAAYDDDDGMPRYYALVHHVASRKPFKMQISWLNSKSTSEYGSLDWIGSGFIKTSGDYKVGKCEITKRLNSFSHSVKWRKGPRGVIQIYPTRGDVWAVYRNWSPDWVDQDDPADETIHKYDVVVVLEDYDEDVGVPIAPLFKVAGFTSVFNRRQQTGTRTIIREEMFRFSHQVPFHILNGSEAENAPAGGYDLDPAALPLELLEVITDAEVSEAVSEGMFECAVKTHRGVESGKNIVTYSRRKKRKEDGK